MVSPNWSPSPRDPDRKRTRHERCDRAPKWRQPPPRSLHSAKNRRSAHAVSPPPSYESSSQRSRDAEKTAGLAARNPAKRLGSRDPDRQHESGLWHASAATAVESRSEPLPTTQTVEQAACWSPPCVAAATRGEREVFASGDAGCHRIALGRDGSDSRCATLPDVSRNAWRFHRNNLHEVDRRHTVAGGPQRRSREMGADRSATRCSTCRMRLVRNACP